MTVHEYNDMIMQDSSSYFISDWLSQSGDLSFWGILITVTYAVTIGAAFMYLKKIRGNHARDLRLLWVCIMAFLLVLGINKQLDLQILLTMIGRSVATHQGWMEHNRAVQKLFAMGLVSCLAVTSGVVLFRVRRVIKQSIIALAGVAVLVFFTIIRVGSINHIRRAISFQREEFTRIHALELLGLLIILAALVCALMKRSGKAQ